MIKKTAHGFKVVSEGGSKNLSSDDLTKAEAVKRLKQVEWFKHHPRSGGSRRGGK